MFEIVKNLDRHRFTPSLLVANDHGHYLSKVRGTVDVHVFPGRYPVWPSLKHLWRAVPDVVFATQRMIVTLGLIAPALPSRTRLIVRQANDVSADFAALLDQSLLKHRVARRIVLRTLRRADAVVCQSNAMRMDLEELLGASANLQVISNPIDVRRVASVVDERPTALRGAPALVAVGRLTRQKGFDLLLPAVARVRQRFPHLHLTILGDGPDRASLEALARRLGIAGAVTFSGFCDDPLPRIHAADLFVLASRYEGFPNAALEALACGTPVVLTNSPGANSEIVVAGANGRLAPALDPDSFAQALELAVIELPDYDRAWIRHDCQKRFSSDRIVAEYESLISSVARQEAA